jgi:hypothetical protein
MNTYKSLLIGIAVCFVASCGAPGYGSKDHWTNKGGKIYKKGDSIVIEGIGIAQGIQNLQLAREMAESRARADVATKLGTFIARLREDYMSSVTDNVKDRKSCEEQFVRVTGKEFTAQMLMGVSIEDRHYDDKKDAHFALAKLDMKMADFASNLKSTVKPVVAEQIKGNAEENLKKLDKTLENALEKGVPTPEK